MLKITKVDTPTEQRLVLEGQLTEPWTAGLSSHWEPSRQARPQCKFIVDVMGVTRIDGSGESALAWMKSEGAEFRARGVRIKHLLENLESKCAGLKSHEKFSLGNERSANYSNR